MAKAKKSRTRQARQRRQKQRRQNRRLLLMAAVVIIAVLAAAVLVVSNQPVDVFVPQGLENRYKDMPRSLSVDGYPQLGSQDAPVTIEEYASFSCPGCQAFHSEAFDDILERVRRGQVLFTYVPMQTGSVPNASGAARAALCAGQQGMFWEMHDVLFDWHTRYVNTAFSQNRLLAGVDALGLNSNAFTTCFNSGAISSALTSAQNEGISSTPAIQVNGVTVPASQAGAIPSANDVLQAVDSATPNDWRPPGEMPEVESTAEPDDAEAEPTEADDAQTEPTEPDDAEVEPSPEADNAETAAPEADDTEIEPAEADDAQAEPAEADDAQVEPSAEPDNAGTESTAAPES